MRVKEIIEVKEILEVLKKDGFIESWELPYENLLTRLSAAIFFINPSERSDSAIIWETLNKFEHFHFGLNTEKKLSNKLYRISFNPEEKMQLSAATINTRT